MRLSSRDQLEPSHLARRLAVMPPAVVKLPPAYRAEPPPSSKTASAETVPLRVALSPLPSADQLEPSHFAMRLAATPPAAEKLPPAKSAGPSPSSCTVRAETPPFSPLPSLDQLEPSHFAIRRAPIPPAPAKPPPAKSAGPQPSSATARQPTLLFSPLPSADQLEPSHFAIRLALTPLALVKSPPAKSAGPLPSSN